MITFFSALIALILGYVFYGRFIAVFFGVDSSRETPAKRLADGVDYQVLPAWKVFLIQLLNIAGLGPIFGAVLGALYGPVAYIWIVLGCIFMGAAHDFFSGFASLRNDGMSLPQLVGKYLGTGTQRFMIFFSGFLLLIVGVVFTNGPAGLLQSMGKSTLTECFGSTYANWAPSFDFWVIVIFLYYLLSTVLPIGKFIGKIYPVFCIALLFMVAGVGGSMIYKALAGTLTLPEISFENLRNFHGNPAQNMIFPMLFIVISCGAISGFHGTQSPMMARCLGNEKLARPIFYGAMIAEGIIALIWATVAIAYFGGPEGLNAAAQAGKTPAIIVETICRDWLGIAGAILAVLGVIVCPITSGDTAFRGIRLIIADTFSFPQHTLKSRLLVSLPIFAVAYFACKVDFSVIWQYLGIGNQILAAITLWTGAAFLASRNKAHWIMSLPATFLSAVCIAYFLLAPYKAGGLAVPEPLVGHAVGVVGALALLVLFTLRFRRQK